MFADIPTNMVVRKHFAFCLQKSSDTTVSFVCCCVDIHQKEQVYCFTTQTERYLAKELNACFRLWFFLTGIFEIGILQRQCFY